MFLDTLVHFSRGARLEEEDLLIGDPYTHPSFTSELGDGIILRSIILLLGN